MFYPLWYLQNPLGFHASGSPQSQHPDVYYLKKYLWPLWSEFSKQLGHMMQELSAWQSKQHQAPLSIGF